MDYIVWTLTIICIVLGIAGTVIPVLPGPCLIALALLAHKLFLPEVLSWWVVVLCLLLAVLSVLVDWLNGALGAKWFGSTKWGMIGAIIGGAVGFLFFNFPGVLIGPLIGALLGELIFAGKSLAQSGKITFGVAVTMMLSLVVKLGLTFVMVLAFGVNVGWHYWGD
jgi:uncharacterized protein